ncbi:thiopeptide-type bacteriocin biosynthesis domain-containing protein [Chitinophaga sp. YR627]|uniref:thiopeptide-type bacteriocin biosynthesis protein n=1 Tax=Chitinophaga sp. YR627 TaxID=1881041 RepID=UPI0008EA94AF|nr:thiopeptide-type bacteriocin biosynthesis protein [Chitinophaga sp. YR627]SFM58310.1 thiopeptide-type bacteriocin biosynthesis domain-containing protein [Chitinophaga sp. YR627]
MQRNWLSAHLFYSGDLRTLLLDMVLPFLSDTCYRAFFIRYGEGGPHIRLRLLTDEADPAIVQSQLIQAGKEIQGLTIQFITYEAEIVRYGNQDSIAWAEEQFICSSSYVLTILDGRREWDASSALLEALKMNIAMAGALDVAGLEMMAICRQFIHQWLPRLYDRSKPAAAQEQYYMALLETRFSHYAELLLPVTAVLWEELCEGKADPVLQTFMQSNRQVFEAYKQLGFDERCMRDITGSFMHMGHNRLGISNLDEAYIMFFTLKCLENVYAGGRSER